MSYRDDALRLPNGMSVAMIKAGAAGIAARADARIAELEREIERLDAQWREELRIYRETDGVDAERYRWLRNGRLAANSWGGIGIPMNYSPTEDDRLALDSTIDAARANGGES